MVLSQGEKLFMSNIAGKKTKKYLANLEKRHCEMKTIKHLKTQDGQYVTNQKEILNEQFHYYNNLWNSNNDQTYDNNVFNVPSKSLTDEEKQLHVYM